MAFRLGQPLDSHDERLNQRGLANEAAFGATPSKLSDLPIVGDVRVGAENSVTSCDLQILVYEASESISSQGPNGRSGWQGSAAGRVLIK